jgi:ferrochelatase
MAKSAVLLVNLGSPASTKVEDVKTYLREFLMDKRVIDAPFPVRWLLVNGVILRTRPAASAEAYQSVWTDEGAPLLVISKALQDALSSRLDVPVYLTMRYGQPSIPGVLEQMKSDGVDSVYMIPLYPHYAMSSYETAVVAVEEANQKMGSPFSLKTVPPFYNDPGYISALVDSAKADMEKGFDKVLFSFHGIPERHVQKADPTGSHCLKAPDCCNCASPAHATCYRHQCYETARLFAEAAGLSPEQYMVSFQSRLGRDPWLQPYTDHLLETLPKEGVNRLLVMCSAFVSDCLETLEEIAMEGKETFLEAGGESFHQIPCLNTHPSWIDYLVGRIEKEFLHVGAV